MRPAFQRWRHSGVSVLCYVFAVFVLVWLKRLVKM